MSEHEIKSVLSTWIHPPVHSLVYEYAYFPPGILKKTTNDITAAFMEDRPLCESSMHYMTRQRGDANDEGVVGDLEEVMTRQEWLWKDNCTEFKIHHRDKEVFRAKFITHTQNGAAPVNIKIGISSFFVVITWNLLCDIGMTVLNARLQCFLWNMETETGEYHPTFGVADIYGDWLLIRSKAEGIFSLVNANHIDKVLDNFTAFMTSFQPRP